MPPGKRALHFPLRRRRQLNMPSRKAHRIGYLQDAALIVFQPRILILKRDLYGAGSHRLA